MNKPCPTPVCAHAVFTDGCEFCRLWHRDEGPAGLVFRSRHATKDCLPPAVLAEYQRVQALLVRQDQAWAAPVETGPPRPSGLSLPVGPRKPGGPGTELRGLLAQLGIEEKPNCPCKAVADWMDHLGVEKCRAKRDEIAKLLRDRQGAYGWVEKLRAAAQAVKIGLAVKVNWLDPFPGLVDEAIRLVADNGASDGPG